MTKPDVPPYVTPTGQALINSIQHRLTQVPNVLKHIMLLRDWCEQVLSELRASVVCAVCAAREENLRSKPRKMWICHLGVGHEVGCPHRAWSEAELRDAGYGHLIEQFTRKETPL